MELWSETLLRIWLTLCGFVRGICGRNVDWAVKNPSAASGKTNTETFCSEGFTLNCHSAPLHSVCPAQSSLSSVSTRLCLDALSLSSHCLSFLLEHFQGHQSEFVVITQMCMTRFTSSLNDGVHSSLLCSQMASAVTLWVKSQPYGSCQGAQSQRQRVGLNHRELQHINEKRTRKDVKWAQKGAAQPLTEGEVEQSGTFMFLTPWLIGQRNQTVIHVWNHSPVESMRLVFLFCFPHVHPVITCLPVRGSDETNRIIRRWFKLRVEPQLRRGLIFCPVTRGAVGKAEKRI